VRSEGGRPLGRWTGRRNRRKRHPGQKRLTGTLLAVALAVTGGCGTGATPAPESEPADDVVATTPPGPIRRIDALVDRAWQRTDAGAPPGSLRVFLSDGTLLMDSCWEVYRLAAWEAASDSTVRWSEDGMPISARLLRVEADQLVLRLELVSEEVEERYELAEAPYVCPEMAR
jgi:hypothetical protein